jgi:hypothetical protein
MYSDIATLWFEAPLVIATRLASVTPATISTAKAQAEFGRMVSEKMAAAGESVVAAQFAMLGEMMKMSTSFALWPTDGAASRVAAKGLRPYAKRVRANSRRLGRRPKQ